MTVRGTVLGRRIARPFPTKALKRDGWRAHGLLVLDVEAQDGLSWEERELLRRIGERLYGKRLSPPDQGSVE